MVRLAVLGIDSWACVGRMARHPERQEGLGGENSSDYLFGKGEPWYVIGMAIFAANIGSEHLVGRPAQCQDAWAWPTGRCRAG
jgi:hypothetical protein